MNIIRRISYIIITGAIILTVACKKDHDMVLKPVIGLQSQPDSVAAIGDTLLLHPVLTGPLTGLSFKWTINGTQVGTDSTYSFMPVTRGNVQLVFTASNAGGSSSVTYTIHVYGKYENGFFIVNEGQYGTSAGNLSFYRYDGQKLELNVFTKENPGKDLGPNTSTTEFGTVFNNKLYLLVKYGGPLVAVDAYSLKETGRIESDPNNSFQALLPIDTTKALVSTANGVFPLNLQTMTLGAPIASINGEADDMVKAGKYIFVLDGNGLDILNASDYTVAKNISNIGLGFAVTTDGAIWTAGNDSLLVKIDPTTLDTTNVKLPFEINSTFGFWHAGSIVASTKENALFLAYNPLYEGGTTIYKYVAGDPSSVSQPFYKLSSGHELYGAGIGYDASSNRLVVTTIESGYQDYELKSNDLDFYDATVRMPIKDLPYTGYYFPAQLVFH